jgi:hypothetical protein
MQAIVDYVRDNLRNAATARADEAQLSIQAATLVAEVTAEVSAEAASEAAAEAAAEATSVAPGRQAAS